MEPLPELPISIEQELNLDFEGLLEALGGLGVEAGHLGRPDEFMARIRAITLAEHVLSEALDSTVQAARESRLKWREVAQARGVSTAAAHQRWQPHVD